VKIFVALPWIFSFNVPLSTALFSTESLHSMTAAVLTGNIKYTPCMSGIKLR
jgi:hypothetical protein